MRWIARLFRRQKVKASSGFTAEGEEFIAKMEAKGLSVDRRHLQLWNTLQGNLHLHMAGMEEVEQGDTSRFVKVVMDAVIAYKNGERPFRPVHFGCSSYDDDDRALFDIPEMRAWCTKLYHELPFIFSVLDAPTIDWFLPSVAKIEVTSRTPGNIQYSYTPALEEMVGEIMQAKKALFNGLALSQEEFDQLVEESVTRMGAVLGRGGA
jgi:hypothetical protein